MGLRCSTAARQLSGLRNAGKLSIPDTIRAKFFHVLSMLLSALSDSVTTIFNPPSYRSSLPDIVHRFVEKCWRSMGI